MVSTTKASAKAKCGTDRQLKVAKSVGPLRHSKADGKKPYTHDGEDTIIPDNFQNVRAGSHAKRTAASTGLRGLRIVENEPFSIQSVTEIEHGT